MNKLSFTIVSAVADPVKRSITLSKLTGQLSVRMFP